MYTRHDTNVTIQHCIIQKDCFGLYSYTLDLRYKVRKMFSFWAELLWKREWVSQIDNFPPQYARLSWLIRKYMSISRIKKSCHSFPTSLVYLIESFSCPFTPKCSKAISNWTACGAPFDLSTTNPKRKQA